MDDFWPPGGATSSPGTFRYQSSFRFLPFFLGRLRVLNKTCGSKLGGTNWSMNKNQDFLYSNYDFYIVNWFFFTIIHYFLSMFLNWCMLKCFYAHHDFGEKKREATHGVVGILFNPKNLEVWKCWAWMDWASWPWYFWRFGDMRCRIDDEILDLPFFLCKICAKKKSPEKPTYHFRQAHIFTNLEDPGIRLMGTLGWWEWFRSIKMIWHRSGGHKFCGSDRPKMTMWVNFIENQGCHWELV